MVFWSQSKLAKIIWSIHLTQLSFTTRRYTLLGWTRSKYGLAFWSGSCSGGQLCFYQWSERQGSGVCRLLQQDNGKAVQMDISREGTYYLKLGLFKPGCTRAGKHCEKVNEVVLNDVETPKVEMDELWRLLEKTLPRKDEFEDNGTWIWISMQQNPGWCFLMLLANDLRK